MVGVVQTHPCITVRNIPECPRRIRNREFRQRTTDGTPFAMSGHVVCDPVMCTWAAVPSPLSPGPGFSEMRLHGGEELPSASNADHAEARPGNPATPHVQNEGSTTCDSNFLICFVILGSLKSTGETMIQQNSGFRGCRKLHYRKLEIPGKMERAPISATAVTAPALRDSGFSRFYRPPVKLETSQISSKMVREVIFIHITTPYTPSGKSSLR